MSQNYYVTPAPQSNGMSKKTLYIVGGLIGAVIIGFLLVFASGSGNQSSDTSQRLLLRLENIHSFSTNKTTTRDIKNSLLSTANTELTLSLSTHLNKLRPLLETQITKSNAKIIASEADLSSEKKLEIAKTNNKFDREYRDILLFKIKNARTYLAESFPSLKGAALKKELQKTHKTLEVHQKKLEDITL